MGQDTGSQQLLPSAKSLPRDNCIKTSDHCIGSSVADVSQQLTPVSASETYLSSLGRAAGSTLSLRRLEHGSLCTHLVNRGLQLSPQTTDQPAEPAHNLFERPIFSFQQLFLFSRLASSATGLDCWSRPRKRSTGLCRVSRCSIRTHFRGNHVVQHLPLPTKHVEAQALENVHGVTQVVTVIPWPKPSAATPMALARSRWQSAEMCSPVIVDTHWAKLRLVKRHRQTICAASLCAVARTARATCSGFIHAASVLQMKGLERHGCEVRINSVVAAIYENGTTLAQPNQIFEMSSASSETTYTKKRTLQEQLTT